jgi:hypothetical protein
MFTPFRHSPLFSARYAAHSNRSMQKYLIRANITAAVQLLLARPQ